MWQQRHIGQPQDAILEIDDIFIGVDFIVGDEVQIRGQQSEGFSNNAHADKVFIVICYKAFNHTTEHIIGIIAVAAVLIYIAEHTLFTVIPYKDVMEIFTDVFC